MNKSWLFYTSHFLSAVAEILEAVPVCGLPCPESRRAGRGLASAGWSWHCQWSIQCLCMLLEKKLLSFLSTWGFPWWKPWRTNSQNCCGLGECKGSGKSRGLLKMSEQSRVVRSSRACVCVCVYVFSGQKRWIRLLFLWPFLNCVLPSLPAPSPSRDFHFLPGDLLGCRQPPCPVAAPSAGSKPKLIILTDFTGLCSALVPSCKGDGMWGCGLHDFQRHTGPGIPPSGICVKPKPHHKHWLSLW